MNTIEKVHGEMCRCTIQCGTGAWHSRPIGSPWRLRDRLARLLGWHCWDCAWPSKKEA
jgi:hypothetical protein